MTREEAISKAINIVRYFEAHFAKSKEAREDAVNIIEALEQEPCDELDFVQPHKKISVNLELCEDEYIKVPKKALKYRTAGMVAYNVEWLKHHFDIERSVICGAQEPCENVPDTNVGDIYECSCGYGWDKSKVVRHHFCPNCGRKMQEVEE